MAVTQLVFKKQIEAWYGRSRYLMNQHFIPKRLREQMNIDAAEYRTRQYFFPKEFQILVDYHQLSEDEINEILSKPK